MKLGWGKKSYIGIMVSMCLDFALTVCSDMNLSTFCNKIWYGWAPLWDGVSFKNKMVCYFLMVKVTVRAYTIKMWLVSHISDELLILLQIKLNLMVCHYKLKYPVKRLDSCVQGQGLGKGSTFQWIFIQMTFSEMLNHCNQMWYSCAISWARMTFKKITFARSGS